MPFTRRKFLKRALLAAPLALGGAVVEAALIEPKWLNIERVSLRPGGHRIAQFSDVHYRGDAPYFRDVVTAINELKPDIAIFTGDLVEEAQYFAPALEILQGIHAPLFGIPGNHDYWADADFDAAREAFKTQGGQWLMDEKAAAAPAGINIYGVTGGAAPAWDLAANQTNILLSHYPDWWRRLGGQKYDLILAGHSHGGQVRLPFVGSLLTPAGVGEFDMGLYQTASGPLYVNPGIGYFYANIRFRCRPEITLFEI